MVSAKIQGLYFKAADGNRTRDLRTTNATLYRLSHSSLWFAPTKCIIAWGKIVCQPLFIGNYSWKLLIMKPARYYIYIFFIYLIDQSVLFINSSAPKP